MSKSNHWGLSAFLFVIAANLFVPMALAVDESSVTQIYESVRGKYPNYADYCKLPVEERRQITVAAVMKLLNEKKIVDPLASGSEAGARLRKDCSLDAASATTGLNLRWMANAQTLRFDSERGSVEDLTSVQSLINRIYAPAGNGPFPAVVLGHTMGGVSQHLLVHAKELLAVGFAVLVVDTYGPRGIKPGSLLLPAEATKDAYDALAHLQSQTYIDRNRIFYSGYSSGGFVAALLASPQGVEAFKTKGRFRATVANYASCALQASTSSPGLEMLSNDSDRPILMLMAELDIETPPKLCFPLLEEMKTAGKDVHWHVYPKIAHGWDKAENNGYVFWLNGESMVYRYDAAVAKDAMERMITFFNRYR